MNSFEKETIKIEKLLPNKGQIEGVPKNPRIIRDSRFEALKKSIQADPEFLEARELIVIPHKDKYVVLCGNQRLKACKELGYEEMPCKVIPVGTSAKKLRAYATKDNIAFGQDDIAALMEEWNEEELFEFGVEVVRKATEKTPKEELEEAFEMYDNNTCVYPIIPKYDEKHELIIILSDSEIDTNNLREKLGMSKMTSYKRNETIKSNVVHIKQVLECLSK